MSRAPRAGRRGAPGDPGLDELVRHARRSRRRAVAPYSGFKVGAALRTRAGEIVTGCNIENATYGLTLCAERVAVFKAVSEGLRRFDAVAVAASSPRPAWPCGPCRQILWEFCGDILVVAADPRGARHVRRLSELLPEPFDGDNL